MASDESQMDDLAERVSRHGSIARGGREIGVSRFRADFLWGRIVARLGEQAR
jgi:hypothetical protein